MKVKAALTQDIIADVFINLSATWLAAAFIVPNFSNRAFPDNLLLLLIDLVFAMVFAVGAYILRDTKILYG